MSTSRHPLRARRRRRDEFIIQCSSRSIAKTIARPNAETIEALAHYQTHCQKVPSFPSLRLSTPKPYLWDETDQAAKWPSCGRSPRHSYQHQMRMEIGEKERTDAIRRVTICSRSGDVRTYRLGLVMDLLLMTFEMSDWSMLSS